VPTLKKTWVQILAILCITAIALVAVSQGIDDVLLKTAFVFIGGIAGYGVKFTAKNKKGNGKS